MEFSGLSKFSLKVFLTAFLYSLVLNASTRETFKVTTVPPEIRRNMNLSEFYQKRVVIGGFSIVGSPKVSDFALKEAAYLIDKMTMKHPEYLQKEQAGDSRTRQECGMGRTWCYLQHRWRVGGGVHSYKRTQQGERRIKRRRPEQPQHRE